MLKWATVLLSSWFLECEGEYDLTIFSEYLTNGEDEVNFNDGAVRMHTVLLT